MCTTQLDDASAVFAARRGRLFGIAYRMLGSVAEAEDVVQDAWLRWHATDRSAVVDATAFLVTTTTRLAINVAQSARARRETSVGPWLPEPVDTGADPALGAERGEALELAVLLLLEKLPPAERAAYVLSEAFDYPYAEIAVVLEVSEANARQLASRARKHLAAGRQDPVRPSDRRRLLGAFLVAARSGDLAGLERLFTSDVVSYADGGGAAGAARDPVAGARRVGRFRPAPSLARCDRRADRSERPWRGSDRARGCSYALLTIGASRRCIDQAFWVMSPDRLAAVVSSAHSTRR